jgi:hypothetical protein
VTYGGSRDDDPVARASRAAERARERVRGMSEVAKPPSESAGEGVASLVSGCRSGVVSITNPPTAYQSESAGEGVASLVSGCRSGVVSITNPPTAYQSESAGEGVDTSHARRSRVVSVTYPRPQTQRGGCGRLGVCVTRAPSVSRVIDTAERYPDITFSHVLPSRLTRRHGRLVRPSHALARPPPATSRGARHGRSVRACRRMGCLEPTGLIARRATAAV